MVANACSISTIAGPRSQRLCHARVRCHGLDHPPRATHTQAADESDPAVNRKHLAVIATQPAERAIEARRVANPNLHPRLTQWFQNRLDVAPALPTSHRSVLPGPLGVLGQPALRQLLAYIVRMNDVVLEVNSAFG